MWPSTAPSVSPSTALQTRTGTLAGDPALEGGCVWLDTSDGRVEVRWPDGYGATTSPVELVGPDGTVIAAQGAAVTVTGTPDADGVSICQVGELFVATDVRT